MKKHSARDMQGELSLSPLHIQISRGLQEPHLNPRGYELQPLPSRYSDQSRTPPSESGRPDQQRTPYQMSGGQVQTSDLGGVGLWVI